MKKIILGIALLAAFNANAKFIIKGKYSKGDKAGEYLCSGSDGVCVTIGVAAANGVAKISFHNADESIISTINAKNIEVTAGANKTKVK
jgi:hypothetical protein